MESWRAAGKRIPITALLHYSNCSFSLDFFLSDDAHGALFLAARRPHGYKFAWSRYPHDRASPGRIADRRRPRAGELRKNDAGCAALPVSRFPMRERKRE